MCNTSKTRTFAGRVVTVKARAPEFDDNIALMGQVDVTPSRLPLNGFHMPSPPPEKSAYNTLVGIMYIYVYYYI